MGAIDAMAQALDDFEVEGLGHNLPFLSAVMGQERFRSGGLTTAYIAEEFPEGFSGVEPDATALSALSCIAAGINRILQDRAAQTSGTIGNHRRVVPTDWLVRIGAHETALKLLPDGDDRFVVAFDDGASETLSGSWRPGQSLARFTVGAQGFSVKIDLRGSGIRLRWRGVDVVARVYSRRVGELARYMPVKLPPDTSRMLLCPMPGMITSITVKAGDGVEAGQTLATVEAMKMENVLKAERKGIVKSIAVDVGSTLAADALIMEFE